MAGGLRDSSLTRVQPFFGRLIAADPTGREWLPRLLNATERGTEALDSLAEEPGLILEANAATSSNGRLRCFEYPVAPPRSLLTWFIENPDRLKWPSSGTFSEDTNRMRRALLFDEPPGREAAKREARDLVSDRPPTAREWWRFEGTSMIDCVLMTDKLVVTIEGKRTEPISSATNWYPQRSQVVRNLEAAKQLADGRKWCSVVMSEEAIQEAGPAAVDSVLAQSAPHLSESEHRELGGAYLGNLRWEDACKAVEIVRFESLPDTTEDL